MTEIRAFFPKIRAPFSNFRKTVRETYPLSPSSYAPGKYQREYLKVDFFVCV